MNYIQSFSKFKNCNEKTTYIVGYWNVKNNKKNSYESHYKPLILKTLNIIKDQNIVFFYENEDVINFIKKNVKNNIIFIKKELMDLPTYKISKDYLETCKQQNTKELSDKFINWDKGLLEKGFIHYHREYKQSGENVFRQLFTIWTSKIFLVQEIIRLNPFHNNCFAWMDVSSARVNVDKKYFTQYYLPNKIYHFSMNVMKYYGIHLPIMGFFIIAHRNIWKKLIPLYEKQLQLSKDSKYAHDEETLLYLIWKDNQDLFCDIKNIKKILFMHFHKSYGTSLITTFSKKYKLCSKNMNGNPWIENSEIILFNEINNNQLISFYNSIHYNFLCLEWNFFKSFNQLHLNLFNIITIIRDPLERYISTYKQHICKYGKDKVNIWDFNKRNYTNFFIGGKMQKCLNQKSFPIIINKFNYYTKMLNGFGNIHNYKIDNSHYKKAISILKTFDVKTDIEIKQGKYNYDYFGIDKIIKTNVNNNKKSLIDDKFKDYFIKNNLYDYKIYRLFCNLNLNK